MKKTKLQIKQDVRKHWDQTATDIADELQQKIGELISEAGLKWSQDDGESWTQYDALVTLILSKLK